MEVDSCQIKQSTVKIATLNLFSPKVNRLFTRKRGLTMNLKDVHPVGKQESNKKITIEITVSTRNGNKRRGYPLLFSILSLFVSHLPLTQFVLPSIIYPQPF